ncbi:hypothetical protein, partial [Escherichia coli]|uniref:hypothetical protein n=1 Tax=Escherichia coli TaxID=562 RepID=UPI0013D82AEA
STGPHSVIKIGQSLGRLRHGQHVRFFELKLPMPEDGGLFGFGDLRGPEHAARHQELYATIDSGIAKNHGVLM